MQKQTLLALSALLLGGLAAISQPVAQAQEVVAPSRSEAATSLYQMSQHVNRLLEEGRHLVTVGDDSGAIYLYQQAANLEPKNPRIFSGIGYLQARQGNFSAAASAYLKAVALAPKNADFQYALGYTLGNLGNNNGAVKAYRRAIQLNRKNINAYLGLGVVMLRQGKYKDALWAYQKAVAIAPNSARAYELKGAVFMKQKRSKEAIAALNRARDLYQRQGYTEGVLRAEAMLEKLRL